MASRTFGPVVLAGLGGGILASVAGSKRWADVTTGVYDPGTGAYQLDSGQLVTTGAAEVPLAGALALVCLACWGVLLLTRGRVRRVLAVAATAAAAALLVTTVLGLLRVPTALRDALVASAGAAGDVDTTLSAWSWAALVGAGVALAAGVVAVREVGRWPEMGSRYDAPTGSAPAAPPAEPEGNLEIWKALDEGHDPTESGRPLD